MCRSTQTSMLISTMIIMSESVRSIFNTVSLALLPSYGAKNGLKVWQCKGTITWVLYERKIVFLTNTLLFQCMRCGTGALGQCVGPNICCSPRSGCQIGTPEARVCEQENRSTTPCLVSGKQCGDGGQGKCVADRVCCDSGKTATLPQSSYLFLTSVAYILISRRRIILIIMCCNRVLSYIAA